MESLASLLARPIKLTYLKANVPLVKTMSTTGVDPYPNVRNLTSTVDSVASFSEFSDSIQINASKGHALLKGPLLRGLIDESRMGLSDKAAPTQWMCMDFDKYMGDYRVVLHELGLSNTTHLIQYSASHGIKPGFSAHIFFILSAPITPAQLKLWFVHQNLNLDCLKPYLQLNKVGTALKYPLDVVTADNSRLLYIAPPIFIAPIVDPVPQRFVVVAKPQQTADLIGVNNITDVGVRRQTLAFVRGLQPKGSTYNVQYTFDKNLGDVLAIPTSPSRVTGIKDDGVSDFIYLNLNNGDSWAYFVRRDDMEFLYNFKGEPIYRTRDIAPEILPKPVVQCFQEYYDEGFLTLHGKDYHYHRTYRMMQGMCNTYGVTAPKVTELNVCKSVYAPDKPTGLSGNARDYVYNKFSMPRLRKEPGKFSTIEKIIRHVCVDDDTYKHFINWLAFIFQKKTKSQAAWVFTGVPGTGKGLLVDKIIAGLFGHQNIVTVQKEVLEGNFNPYMADNLFVVFDEAKFNLQTDRRIDHKLKVLITSPEIQVNDKNIRHRMRKSYGNLIVTSNERDVIHISKDDRRFNIAPRQEIPLKSVLTDIHEVVQRIEKEMRHFAFMLEQLTIDKLTVNKPIENAHRDEFIERGRQGLEVVADIVLSGNRKMLEELHMPEVDCVDDPVGQTYLNAMIERVRGESITQFSKKDLFILTKACAHNPPKTAKQFVRQISSVGISFDDGDHITTEWSITPPKIKPFKIPK